MSRIKKAIKKILNNLGLLRDIQNIHFQAKYWRYKECTTWNLNIGNLNLMYDTTDSYSSKWFYPRYGKGNVHEPIATDIFINYIHEKSNVLDIGAHLGYFTCLAAKLAPNGKTYAFDVDPKCLELINRNINLNNLKNVEIKNFAISDKNEIVRIQKLEAPNPGLVINFRSNSNYIDVESITIDDFVLLTEVTPDFIKIDVEGAEANVLKGMKKTLKQDKLIILLEIHVNHLIKYFNTDYSEIIDILLKNNFIIENIDHRLNKSSFQTVNRNTVLKGNTMLICKKI